MAAGRGPRPAPSRSSRRWAPPPRSSRCCGRGAPASPPSSPPPPGACPTTSSGHCGTAWPGACHVRRVRRHPGPCGRAPAVGSPAARSPAARGWCRIPSAPAAVLPAGSVERATAARPAGGRSCREGMRPTVRRTAELGRLDRDELAEAVAEQLLNRWGVVFRDLALHDSLRLPWRELQWALRRLEDRGLVRGGRFVSGFQRRAVRAARRRRAAHPRAQAPPHAASGSPSTPPTRSTWWASSCPATPSPPSAPTGSPTSTACPRPPRRQEPLVPPLSDVPAFEWAAAGRDACRSREEPLTPCTTSAVPRAAPGASFGLDVDPRGFAAVERDKHGEDEGALVLDQGVRIAARHG